MAKRKLTDALEEKPEESWEERLKNAFRKFFPHRIEQTLIFSHKDIEYIVQEENSGDQFIEVFKEKYHWWDVYLTGIRPPIYDGYTASGLTFSTIAPLFSNLVHVPKGSTVKIGIFKRMPDSDDVGNTGYFREHIYCPTAYKLISLPISVDIAVNSIDTYLQYKERIGWALNKFEGIYGIDKSTNISEMSKEYKKLYSLSYGDEYFKLRDQLDKKYPNSRETMVKLITEFGLDFMKKWK